MKSIQEFKYESASCTVIVRGKQALITRVYSHVRSKGHATGLMRIIVEWADKNDLELRLSVRSYGKPIQDILNNQQLVEFYKKFGFEIDYARSLHPSQPMMIRTKNTGYNEREN